MGTKDDAHYRSCYVFLILSHLTYFIIKNVNKVMLTILGLCNYQCDMIIITRDVGFDIGDEMFLTYNIILQITGLVNRKG